MSGFEDEQSLRGRRILIVEDESLVAMELESLLQRQGCNVIGPAHTVGRALELVEQDKIEAALLDLNLNGEAATPIAKALSVRDIPFVIVTGYSAMQISEPELQEAPRLNKPVTEGRVLRALVQVLGDP